MAGRMGGSPKNCCPLDASRPRSDGGIASTVGQQDGQRVGRARFAVDGDENGATRSFCSRCGSPVLYQRQRSPQNLNIPRALFMSGAGREPRYHIGIDQLQEWTYLGEPLSPLKGFPGVVWTRGRKKRGPAAP